MASAMCKTPGKLVLLSRTIFQEKPSPFKVATPPRSLRKAPALQTSPQTATSDRFIPCRKATHMDILHFNFTKRLNSCDDTPGTPLYLKENYQRQLAENFLQSKDATEGSRILAFKQKPPPSTFTFADQRPHITEASSKVAGNTCRHIPQSEEKVLDAPGLQDDYYLNLVSWSNSNILAVALGSSVYLLDASTNSTEQLMDTTQEDSPVTCVAWAPDGQHLAIGMSTSEVSIWDTKKLKQVRTLSGHAARVGSLSWNGSTLSSGSLDSTIINHDVRIREHITSRFTSHEKEVCGLQWSPSGRQLASGGNDNVLHIWEASTASSSTRRSGQYLHKLVQHQAAVKALAWCPFQSNLLASGAGSSDRCIKFWNTYTGACVQSIQTHSQVCGLVWSPNDREILSSHGFTTESQLCLWNYPSLARTAELKGHATRAGYLAVSPNGSTVVSGGDDETLRFWKVFNVPISRRNERGSSGTREASTGSLLQSTSLR